MFGVRCCCHFQKKTFTCLDWSITWAEGLTRSKRAFQKAIIGFYPLCTEHEYLVLDCNNPWMMYDSVWRMNIVPRYRGRVVTTGNPGGQMYFYTNQGRTHQMQALIGHTMPVTLFPKQFLQCSAWLPDCRSRENISYDLTLYKSAWWYCLSSCAKKRPAYCTRQWKGKEISCAKKDSLLLYCNALSM